MNRHVIQVAGTVLALICATSGFAAQRTFVASNGSDAALCTRAQPCRSFAAALGQTAVDGELVVLDSAGYGPVIIAQSVTISAPAGVHAGITVFPSDNGIEVNAPGARVRLSGLEISGQGGGYGIWFIQGARLEIDRCLILGMSAHGVYASANNGLLVMNDTTVTANNWTGVHLEGAMTAVLERSRTTGNGIDGIRITVGAAASLRDFTATGNQQHGVHLLSDGGGPSLFTQITADGLLASDNVGDGLHAEAINVHGMGATISRATFTRNENGIAATGGFNRVAIVVSYTDISSNRSAGIIADGSSQTRVYVRGSTVSRNTTGVASSNGAIVYSLGDNFLPGNMTAISGTVDPNPPKF